MSTPNRCGLAIFTSSMAPKSLSTAWSRTLPPQLAVAKHRVIAVIQTQASPERYDVRPLAQKLAVQTGLFQAEPYPGASESGQAAPPILYPATAHPPAFLP